MAGPRRVLVVTGASRGIGAATARAAAARGYAVCVNCRRERQAADAVVADIIAAGGMARAVPADIGREDEVARLFAAADDMGPLAGLVNNAGITGGFAPAAEVARGLLEEVFAANFFGAVACTREAVRRLSTRRGGEGGAIVNVSSQAAAFGGRNLAHYGASKAALETYTRALAREVAADGIRVNAVSPAVIDTDQHADVPEERRAALLGSIPAGRMGTPAEAAEAILWLLSDAASYVSGAVLPVTGGR